MIAGADARLADNVEEVAGLRASIPHAGAMLNLALDKLVIHWMSVEEDSRRTRIRPPEARPMARRFSKLGPRAVSLFCEDYENRDERAEDHDGLETDRAYDPF